ncbi:MAG: hypothetical protein AAGH78_16580 [Cyanobacteria bacterium P01_H01_bin.58]
MNQPAGFDRDAEQACSLLSEYSFELVGFRPSQLVALWQEQLAADSSWIRSAVIEALYQGRYKALSVEQILKVWKRRGHPLKHFNHEFERVVLGPIDPMASRYAPMTTLSPSEFLMPQQESKTPLLAQDPEASEGVTSQSSVELEATVELPPTDLPEVLPNSHTETSDMPEAIDMQESRGQVPLPVPQQPAAIYTQSVTFSQPEPIQSFVPQPQTSEAYWRLQSVVRQSF